MKTDDIIQKTGYPIRSKNLMRKIRSAEGFLATNLKNIRYLTGFTGSNAYAILTKTNRLFMTDFRYKEQSSSEVPGWDIEIIKDPFVSIKKYIAKLGIKTLGFENTVSYGFYEKLKAKGIILKPFDRLVEKQRSVKDPNEISYIKEAVRRAESAYVEILPRIKKGISEVQIARRLEEAMLNRGGRHVPFDIIVASGPNSSLPHAKATDRRLRAGDLVVIDWGAEAGGYFSDMTRTLLINGPDLSKKKEIYGLVLKANLAGMRAVKQGAKARDIDFEARTVIEKAGYGRYFGHGLGHGVGLDVHEMPNISSKSKDIVKSGMVFTIEPGVYIPGLGGVRLEDMLVVNDGKDVLTSLSKELKIID